MRISDWSSDVCSSDLAEIWHGRPARLFRRRSALAGPLRVRRAVAADAERGDFGMKITLDWPKEHLDGGFTVADVVATLNRLGHDVLHVAHPVERLAGFRVATVLAAEANTPGTQFPLMPVPYQKSARYGQRMSRSM